MTTVHYHLETRDHDGHLVSITETSSVYAATQSHTFYKDICMQDCCVVLHQVSDGRWYANSAHSYRGFGYADTREELEARILALGKNIVPSFDVGLLEWSAINGAAQEVWGEENDIDIWEWWVVAGEKLWTAQVEAQGFWYPMPLSFLVEHATFWKREQELMREQRELADAWVRIFEAQGMRAFTTDRVML